MIMRNGKTRIPDSQLDLMIGDKLLFFTKPENETIVEDLFN